MRVMIDPGHGGSDPGAIGATGVPEKEIALAVSLQIGGLLAPTSHEIGYTRADDLYPTLEERCRIARDWGANVFVSVHCNSFSTQGPNGFEVFTNPAQDSADFLATRMWNVFRDAHPDMRGRVDLSDGDPDKESKFYVLVNTPCPAVLFELAFISNPKDESRLLLPSWQSLSALALATSINEWAAA